MKAIIIIPLIVAGFIVIFILSEINANKKLKAMLINSFGKKPNDLDYDLSSIEGYHFEKSQCTDNIHCIDDMTFNDLDMGKVFKQINVCLTSVGEEYLYEVLHEPKFDQVALLKREKLITYLKEHPSERLRLQIYLSKFGKSNFNGLSSLIFNSNNKSLKYPVLYKILALITVICIAIIPFNVSLGVVCLITSSIINGIVYYKSKIIIDRELSAIQCFSSMLWCCNKICKMNSSGFNLHINELKQKFNVFKSLRGRMSGIMQKSISDIKPKEIILEKA